MFEIFKSFPELLVSFSTRADGDMKLKDATPESLENRKRYMESLGLSPDSVIGVMASHGADVMGVGAREAGAAMRRVDGLLTHESGIFLSVTGGDCLLIYLYDPQERLVALLHAGWQGMARGIIAKTLRQFQSPERVRVAVSPFIQQCHFEVKEDVARVFGAYPPAITTQDGKTFIDLGIVARQQLLEAGVKSEYTEISSECTACLSDKYFSYRRDKPGIPEVMIGLMGIRKT